MSKPTRNTQGEWRHPITGETSSRNSCYLKNQIAKAALAEMGKGAAMRQIKLSQEQADILTEIGWRKVSEQASREALKQAAKQVLLYGWRFAKPKHANFCLAMDRLKSLTDSKV